MTYAHFVPLPASANLRHAGLGRADLNRRFLSRRCSRFTARAWDQFDEQFIPGEGEPVTVSLREGAAFVPSRNGASHDSDDSHPVHPEVSIYTDDPVRVYLREMGAVPLLTRKGEIDLARRMERGKNQVYRAVSRSRLIVARILSFYEQIKKGDVADRGRSKRRVLP